MGTQSRREMQDDTSRGRRQTGGKMVTFGRSKGKENEREDRDAGAGGETGYNEVNGRQRESHREQKRCRCIEVRKRTNPGETDAQTRTAGKGETRAEMERWGLRRKERVELGLPFPRSPPIATPSPANPNTAASTFPRGAGAAPPRPGPGSELRQQRRRWLDGPGRFRVCVGGWGTGRARPPGIPSGPGS